MKAGAGIRGHLPPKNRRSIKTRSRGANFIEKYVQPLDRSRVAEILAHPLGWVRLYTLLKSDFGGRCLGLQFIRQSIEIARLLIMQKTAHGAEKIKCSMARSG